LIIDMTLEAHAFVVADREGRVMIDT